MLDKNTESSLFIYFYHFIRSKNKRNPANKINGFAKKHTEQKPIVMCSIY